MVVLNINNGLGQGDIYLTPEAFTNWYNNNQSAISSSGMSSTITSFYNQLLQPIGNFSNQEDYTANYIASQGWYWLSWSQYQQQSGLVGSFENDLATLLSDNTSIYGVSGLTNAPLGNNYSELYVLVSSSPNSSAIGTPGVQGTTNGNSVPSSQGNPNASGLNLPILPSWTWYILLGAGVFLILVFGLGMAKGGVETVSGIQSISEHGEARKQRREAHKASIRQSEAKTQAYKRMENLPKLD